MLGSSWQSSWLWGMLLCVVANVLNALGLVLQKFSHIKNTYQEQSVIFYRQPWWLLGFMVFLAGQLTNFSAMALAPQAMLSCLGACSLIFNAVFARSILGEEIDRPELAAMMGIIFGMGVVILNTPSTSEPAVVDEMDFVMETLQQCEFIALASVSAGLLASGWFAVKQLVPEYISIFWALVAAVLSGFTMTFFKCVSLLLARGHQPWGDSMTVVPTSFALGMLAQILTAAVAFKELRFVEVRQAVVFCLGLLATLASIVAMVRAQLSAEVESMSALSKDPEATPTSPLLRKARTSSCGSLSRVSSLDASAFPESFEDAERVYMVSLAGPMGVA